MSDRMEGMKHWPCRIVSWMEWLDVWGYVTAGLSLLILGMLIFVQSWYTFINAASHAGLLPAGLRLLNDLLLVIILLELYRTVIRFADRHSLGAAFAAGTSPAPDEFDRRRRTVAPAGTTLTCLTAI
jgi:hypothetical protein